MNYTSTTQYFNLFRELTGNVFIIMDEKNDIYFQSINSNEILKQNILKKISINENLSYGENIKNYYNKTKELTPEVFYDNSKDVLLNEKELYFSENNCVFGGLFICKNIPDYFIIFKHKKNNTIDEIINNGEIIKSYNLKNSKIDKLIKNSYIDDLIFERNYFQSKKYYLYGYNIETGFKSKYNITYDDYNKSEDEIKNDLKKKFKENNIITFNYLNLKYVFNSNIEIANDEEISGFYFNQSNIIKDSLDTQQYFIKEIYDDNKLSFTKLLPINNVYLKNSHNFAKNSTEIFVLKDKNNIFYNIKNQNSDKQLILNTKEELFFNNFYGLEKNSGFQIFSKPLDGLDFQNLKFSIHNVKKINTKFSEGDYLSIKVGNGLSYDWRVIFSDNRCCNPNKYCYSNEKTINTVGVLKNIAYYEGLKVLEFEIDDLIYMNEGETINITTNKYTKITVNLDFINYDVKLKKTIIKIIDKNYLFNYEKEIDKINIEYTSKPYFFTFINTIGDNEYLCHQISKAFNSFDNKLFETYHQDNNVIFKSFNKDNAFENLKFEYNFVHSNTILDNFSINNKKLLGKKYYNMQNNLLFARNRNIINFTGKSLQNSQLRFKLEIDNNIDFTDVVIETKKGFYKLKTFMIEDNITYNSNYLDEFKNNKFRNIEKFNIYTVDSNNDSILLNHLFQINASYIYNPTILKLEKIQNL